MSTEETRLRLNTYLASRAEVLFAYVFGSTARGDDRPDSDVDVAVFIDPRMVDSLPASYRSIILAGLISCLGRNDIDLVLLNVAPTVLSHRVLRDGRLLLSRNEAQRVEFAERVMRNYFDTAYLRRLWQESIARSVKDGTFGKPVTYKTPFV